MITGFGKDTVLDSIKRKLLKSYPVPENSSAQSRIQRTRGSHEKTPGGRSCHRQKRQSEIHFLSFILFLSFYWVSCVISTHTVNRHINTHTHTRHQSNSSICVWVCFSWRPLRSTGPAEEATCQPCSSSSTREPSSPTETRLVRTLDLKDSLLSENKIRSSTEYLSPHV